jgi:hypothetical protein
MKLSQLLSQRTAALRRARLANLGYAHEVLRDFIRRARAAQLHGRLHVRSADPDAECYAPLLIALDANNSVVEEHFTDEDIATLADVLEFVTGRSPIDLTFEIDAMDGRFVGPIRAELRHAGVTIDSPLARIREESNQP